MLHERRYMMVPRDNAGLSVAIALAVVLCALFISVVLAVTFSTTRARAGLPGPSTPGLASNHVANSARGTQEEEEAMVEELRKIFNGQRR